MLNNYFLSIKCEVLAIPLDWGFAYIDACPYGPPDDSVFKTAYNETMAFMDKIAEIEILIDARGVASL